MKTDKKQMIVFNVIPIPILAIGLVLLYITNLLEKSGHNLLIDIIGTISIIFIVLYLLSTIGFMINEIVYIVSAFKKNEYNLKFKVKSIVFSSINIIVYISFVLYILEKGEGV